MRLVFLGPPGAGKGTQAQRFSQRLGLLHISTGDILRRAIAHGTPTGVEAQQFVDRGALVPFAIVLRLVRDRLHEPDAGAGWILDGFPRNLEQAHAFQDLLGELCSPLDRVVYFQVSSEHLIERLSGRRTCRGCGAVYHLRFSPPRVAGVCDKCQATDLYQRTDDVEDRIRHRLTVYEQETAPLVDHFVAAGLLLTVDAGATPAEVERALLAGLGVPGG